MSSFSRAAGSSRPTASSPPTWRSATAWLRRSPRGSTATTCLTPAAAWWVRASSTSTPTYVSPAARKPRPSSPGARAAALGGYTAIIAMPNTEPAIDCASVVREVLELGAGAPCDVHVAGAITVDRAGERLAPLAEMAELGVRLFTDDGTGVQDGRLMRRALEYSTSLNVTLAQHCEDAALAAGGHMHEGEWSSRLGIPGIPAEAEEVMIMRDLALARLTGAQHPLPARVDGRIGRVVAARRGRRDQVHGRSRAAPLLAHRRGDRHLRPTVQGEPTVAFGGRCRRHQDRVAGRHHRRHRHGSRARTRRKPRRRRSTRRRRA